MNLKKEYWKQKILETNLGRKIFRLVEEDLLYPPMYEFYNKYKDLLEVQFIVYTYDERTIFDAADCVILSLVDSKFNIVYFTTDCILVKDVLHNAGDLEFLYDEIDADKIMQIIKESEDEEEVIKKIYEEYEKGR